MSKISFVIVCLAMLAGLGVSAQAASRIWANSAGNTNWFSTASWTGSVVPSSNDVAQLDNLTVAAYPYLAGVTNVNALLINNGGADKWRIYGRGTLTIMGTPGSTGYGIHVSAGGIAHTYPDIVLGGKQTWMHGIQSGQPHLWLHGTLSGTGPLTKLGTQPMTYENTNAPTFKGGFLAAGEASRWNLLLQATARTESFGLDAAGTGPGMITVSNGIASGFSFNTSIAATPEKLMTLTNPFTVDRSGGRLDNAQGGPNPYSRNVFSGTIALNGPLGLLSTGSGNSTRLTGQVTLGRATAEVPGLYLGWQNSDSSARQTDFEGAIVDGAGAFSKPLVLRTRGSSNPIAILAAGNTYAGGTVVEFCSDLDRSNSMGASIYAGASAVLGVGDVLILPGGKLRLMANTNVAAGKALRVTSTPAEAGVVAVAFATAPSALTSDSDGILAINNGFNFNAPLNMATVGNGSMFLGTGGGATYSATSLLPGAGNVYRLGGAAQVNYGRATLDFSSTSLVLADVGGASSLQVGRPGFNGNATVYVRGSNTFTGDILVTGQMQMHDATGGSELWGYVRYVAGQSPFGAATGNVRLQHGTLRLEGGNTGVPVAKGKLTFEGTSYVVVNSQTGNYATQITFDSLARTNNGTLLFNAAQNRGGGNEKFLLVNTNNVPVVNGICPTYLLASQAEFLRYTAANGFERFPAASYAAMPPAGTGTEVVAHTGAVVGTPNIWALKATGALTGAGPITINGGGLILLGNCDPAVNFGTAEGVIFPNTNADPPRTIAGKVSGSGGITVAYGSLRMSNVANDFTGLITVNSVAGGYPGPRLQVQYDTLAGPVTRGLGNANNDILLNGAEIQQVTAGDAFLSTRTLTLGPLGGQMGSTVTIYGPVTGAGFLYVRGGTTTLDSGANDYTGGTRVSGALVVNGSSSVGTGAVLLNYGSATFKGNANISTGARLYASMNTTATFQSAAPAIGSLCGAGFVVLGNTGVDTTLTVGQDNTSCAFYGKISQFTGRVGSVTKAGNGTWTLYGAHAYTGTTTVNAGTLKLCGSLAGGLTVGSSGGLAVDLGANGASYGTVAGAVNLNGSLTVTMVDGYVPAYGDEWTIIGGASSYNGGFTSVTPAGFEVDADGSNLVLSYPPRGTLLMIR